MKIGFIVKIFLMVLALVAVLYVIQSLKAPVIENAAQDPNSFIGILVGSDQRMLNWCPGDVEKVEIFQGDSATPSQTLTAPKDLSAVCEIFVGGFSQGDQPPQFKVKMKAFSKGAGNPVSLEKAQDAPIFRFKGMPFASSGLEKALKRLERP